MSNIATTFNRILPSTKDDVEKVQKLYDVIKEELTLIEIDTHHVIHGGMYARTIKIPAGAVIAGAMIKIGTILIAQGGMLIHSETGATELSGYNVFAASANRKQAYYAITDVYLTMIFPTEVKTVQEAEDQFTDEADLLLSRKFVDNNTIIITGE